MKKTFLTIVVLFIFFIVIDGFVSPFKVGGVIPFPPARYWLRDPHTFAECLEASRNNTFTHEPVQCDFREKIFERNLDAAKSATPPSGQENIPKEYVKVVRDSAKTATFEFAVAVRPEDITGAKIQHCVIDVSSGATEEGRKPDCTPANQANGFALRYDGAAKVTISDISDGTWGKGELGPFRLGCAACSSAVQFSRIHTASGTLLPDKLVVVY